MARFKAIVLVIQNAAQRFYASGCHHLNCSLAKRRVYIVGIVLTCALTGFFGVGLGSASGATLRSTPVDIMVASDRAERIINATIQGVTFSIPKSYLGTPYGIDKGGLWMLVLLPDMIPRTEKNRDLFRGREYMSRHLRIGIEGAWPGRGAIQGFYARRNALGLFEPSEKTIYSLTMERARTGPGTPASQTGHDYYTSGSLSSPDTFVCISCASDLASEGRLTGPRSIESAICIHAFVYQNVLVKLTYKKSNLPEWNSIQKGVESLLNRLSEDSVVPKSTLSPRGDR